MENLSSFGLVIIDRLGGFADLYPPRVIYDLAFGVAARVAVIIVGNEWSRLPPWSGALVEIQSALWGYIFPSSDSKVKVTFTAPFKDVLTQAEA